MIEHVKTHWQPESECWEMFEALMDRPPDDTPMEDVLGWIYSWPEDTDERKQRLDELTDLFVRLDPSEQLGPCEAANAVGWLCRMVAIPDGSNRHEQPHDFKRLFPLPLTGLPISEYVDGEWDAERPLEHMTPAFFVEWAIAMGERFKSISDEGAPSEEVIDEAYWDILMMGARLLALATPKGMYGYFEIMKRDLKYLVFTRGCFDLESGALIDRETPVIRELKDKWGLE